MEQIVVGVDGSDNARRALEWALDEAGRRQARLRVVHVWDAPFEPTWGTMGIDIARYETAARDLLDEEISRAPSTTPVTVEKVPIRGPAAATLVKLSKDADLLVVGSRGHGGFTALRLGSVSQQVAQHSECPVVIVHSH